MKELSIEEKAKRYDEIREKAQKWYDANTNEGYRGIFEDIFPELKESDDERYKSAIRKMYSFLPNKPKYIGDVSVENMFAWLEAQGKNNMGISESTKQKLEDNLNNALAIETTESWNEFLDGSEQKPVAKYKVGDTIYYNSFGRLVSFVIANIVEDGTDNPMYEDKDGNSVFQNDIVEQKTVNLVAILNDYFANTPKEQQDKDWEELKNLNNFGWELVEQKSADADLKDIVDKEANAIWKEINTGGSHSIIDSFNQFYGICMQVAEAVMDYQRPAWSEEDETVLNNLIYALANDRIGNSRDEYVNWLKSFKERYTWKPSEGQMIAIDTAINVLGKGTLNGKQLIELQEQLKKLK